MSGEPKTLTLAERESYLISRVGDAWVELNRKHYDFARDELAEAQIAADDVTEAAARARDEAAELRAAIREWVEADRAWYETAPPLDVDEIDELGDRSLAADLALYRLAGANTESKDATRAEGGKPHPERSDALRSAAREYLEALDYVDMMLTGDGRATSRAGAALEALRRLAGGENEK